MKLELLAVGRLKAGPERELMERYGERLAALARPQGFVFATREIAESRARDEATRKAQEGRALLGAVGDGVLMAFDEGGRTMTSSDFARHLGGLRDQGRPALHLVVGGPDGLAETVVSRAQMSIAFGAMTLPHQLVRVLVAEQLYRAMTILSGHHPYHRL